MPIGSIVTRGNAVTFVDANVLLYAYDASETVKQPVAQAVLEGLWHARTGVVSTQILQEFYAVATSKLKQPMRPARVREIVALYSAWPVVLIEPPLILTASHVAEKHRLSFWDALIIEAARAGGAVRLLTEDLNDGQSIEGIRIENPFRSDPGRVSKAG
jgi:predicted nucleic acid-binding protein